MRKLTSGVENFYCHANLHPVNCVAARRFAVEISSLSGNLVKFLFFFLPLRLCNEVDLFANFFRIWTFCERSIRDNFEDIFKVLTKCLCLSEPRVLTVWNNWIIISKTGKHLTKKNLNFIRKYLHFNFVL